MPSDDDLSILLAHVPADGSTIGNGALRSALGWEETRYEAARDALVAQQRLVKGSGDSVRLPGSAAVPAARNDTNPAAMTLPGSAAVPAARKVTHPAGESPSFPGGTLPGNAAVPAARNDTHPAGETPALPGGTLPGSAAVPAAAGVDCSSRRDAGAPRMWRSRDYLPHFDGVQIPQFITYHLADSLPRQALERMEAELREMPDDERKAL